jgi:hypothetical protein
MSYFEQLSQHWSEGLRETTRNISRDNRPAGRLSNAALLRYEAEPPSLSSNVSWPYPITDTLNGREITTAVANRFIV